MCALGGFCADECGLRFSFDGVCFGSTGIKPGDFPVFPKDCLQGEPGGGSPLECAKQCCRGLGAGGGLGGFAVPDFGRANAFPSTGVASETRGFFSKRWPSAETGGGLRPLGRAKSKAPFGFQGEFCYSQTI